MVDTLTDYERFNSDTQCSVGLLNFSYFEFATGGDDATLTADDIMVTPMANGTMGGGFKLSPEPDFNFTVPSGDTASYIVDWFFQIDPGPIANGADLGMDPPLGDVTITQKFCLDSNFDANGNCAVTLRDFNSVPFAPQTLQVMTLPPPGVLFNSLTFNPPAQNFGNVSTTIALDGDSMSLGCPSGMDGSCFDSVTGTLSVVVNPEPGTALLGLIGLLALGRLRKRAV